MPRMPSQQASWHFGRATDNGQHQMYSFRIVWGYVTAIAFLMDAGIHRLLSVSQAATFSRTLGVSVRCSWSAWYHLWGCLFAFLRSV